MAFAPYRSWYSTVLLATTSLATVVLAWTAISAATSEKASSLPRSRDIYYTQQLLFALPSSFGSTDRSARLLVFSARSGWPAVNRVFRLLSGAAVLLVSVSLAYLPWLWRKSQRRLAVAHAAANALCVPFVAVALALDALRFVTAANECDSASCTYNVPDKFVGPAYVCECRLQISAVCWLILDSLLLLAVLLSVLHHVARIFRHRAAATHPLSSVEKDGAAHNGQPLRSDEKGGAMAGVNVLAGREARVVAPPSPVYERAPRVVKEPTGAAPLANGLRS